MTPLKIILTIVFVIVGVILVGIILKQESKQNGLSGALMGSSATAEDSYWAKNKSRSREGKLVVWTRILIAALLVLGILINIKF